MSDLPKCKGERSLNAAHVCRTKNAAAALWRRYGMLVTICRGITIAALFVYKKRPQYLVVKVGTPGGNRTHNGPLGGGCYIHLTTEAYYRIASRRQAFACSGYLPKPLKGAPRQSSGLCPRANPQRPLRRGLLYPFNYGSILYLCFTRQALL